MDNLPCVTLAADLDLDAYEELPREEALTRLYERRNAHGLHAASLLASGAMREHLDRFGHLLRQGCCEHQPERVTAATVV